jgi:hypothetical protein
MSKRKNRAAQGIILLSSFPIAWLIMPYIVNTDATVCFFRTFTSKPCPFCGLTRAICSATHGDFLAAFEYHNWWWLVMLAMTVVAILAIVDGISASNLVGRLRQNTAFADTYLTVFFIIFLLYRCLV